MLSHAVRSSSAESSAVIYRNVMLYYTACRTKLKKFFVYHTAVWQTKPINLTNLVPHPIVFNFTCLVGSDFFSAQVPTFVFLQMKKWI